MSATPLAGSGSSSSAIRSWGRPPGWCLPSSAPTWSRSSRRRRATTPAARRLRRRVLRRLQPQQAQPRGRSEAPGGPGGDPSAGPDRRCRSRKFRPRHDGAARLRLEQLAPLNPRLVYLALKGYLAGPYEHRPALDEVVQFQTGLAFMTGPPGQPLRAGASVIDIMGAVFGVVAAQAALREREITGKGQRVSSALFESAAFLMSTHMAGMAATGLEARPMPARRGAWAIYEVFKTAGGGQLFIGVTSDQQWTRFVEEFGLQELAADPRLATNVMRLAERAWLIPALQEVLATLPQDEVARRCERAQRVLGAGRPAGRPVRRPASAGDRRAGRRVHLPLWRRRRQAGRPAGPAGRVRRRPPAPRPQAPAAAHGRAQCRGAGEAGFSPPRSPHWPKAASSPRRAE